MTNIHSGLPDCPPTGLNAGKDLQFNLYIYIAIIIEALKSNQMFIFRSSVLSQIEF